MTQPKEGELVPRKSGRGMGLDAPKNHELREKLRKALREQHPMHAVFGTAFEEIGGIEKLVQWGTENYTEFIKIFGKMAPAGGGSGSGKIQIQINNQLQPTKLDE